MKLNIKKRIHTLKLLDGDPGNFPNINHLKLNGRVIHTDYSLPQFLFRRKVKEAKFSNVEFKGSKKMKLERIQSAESWTPVGYSNRFIWICDAAARKYFTAMATKTHNEITSTITVWYKLIK